MLQNIEKDYQKEKSLFLDSLQPDDFRNASSFNQAEEIINKIHKSLHQAILNNKDPEEYIEKSFSNLFRENSDALQKAKVLSKLYLEKIV